MSVQRDYTEQARLYAIIYALFLAVCLLMAASLSPAKAAGADCGLIRDTDMRRQCYAIRDRKPSDCGLVRDNDARRLCRAQSGSRY